MDKYPSLFFQPIEVCPVSKQDGDIARTTLRRIYVLLYGYME